MSKQLSVIVPYCNEFPAIMFTVQSVLEQIRNIDGEVVVVDNYCHKDLNKQKVGETFCPSCIENVDILRTPDKGGQVMQEKAKNLPNLKYVRYSEKLSHWNAKNAGVAASEGKILLFLDAHVVPGGNSLTPMFDYYINNYEALNGTLHLPLAYMLANTSLIYKFESNPEKGFYHYQFSVYKLEDKPRKVAVMSTCGMMISRELYDLLGGWPKELGIYGGGENFINFSLAILGKDKHIMNTRSLSHFADERGYHYNYDDFIRNRTISVYITAGKDAAHRFIRNCKGNPEILEKIYQNVLATNKEHKNHIVSKQQMSISEWMEKIKKEGLWDGVLSTKEYVS